MQLKSNEFDNIFAKTNKIYKSSFNCNKKKKLYLNGLFTVGVRLILYLSGYKKDTNLMIFAVLDFK